MPNTIILKGSPPRFEGEAGGTITPGDLLVFSSGELIVHGTTNGAAEKMVAVNQDFLGEEITETYADGDEVQYVVAQPGDVLYMWLQDGETSAIGSPLSSDGNGKLDVLTIADTVVIGALIGWAMEAVAASGAAARIRVRMA